MRVIYAKDLFEGLLCEEDPIEGFYTKSSSTFRVKPKMQIKPSLGSRFEFKWSRSRFKAFNFLPPEESAVLHYYPVLMLTVSTVFV